MDEEQEKEREVVHFRMYTIYPRLQRVEDAPVGDPESVESQQEIASAVRNSRKIELLIEQLRHAMRDGLGYSPGKELLSVMEDLRYYIWKGELPGWVMDCLRLGSWIPLIENIELVIQSTGDGLVYMYLREKQHILSPV